MKSVTKAVSDTTVASQSVTNGHYQVTSHTNLAAGTLPAYVIWT